MTTTVTQNKQPLQSTQVITLEPDVAAFLGELGQVDVSSYINQVLREQQDRMGLRGKIQPHDTHDKDLQKMENEVDRSIPSAG